MGSSVSPILFVLNTSYSLSFIGKFLTHRRGNESGGKFEDREGHRIWSPLNWRMADARVGGTQSGGNLISLNHSSCGGVHRWNPSSCSWSRRLSNLPFWSTRKRWMPQPPSIYQFILTNLHSGGGTFRHKFGNEGE